MHLINQLKIDRVIVHSRLLKDNNLHQKKINNSSVEESIKDVERKKAENAEFSRG